MSLACLLAPLSASYRPREPQNSPLYKVVQAHLGTFLASRHVPGYVRRAFLRFLDCGVLAKGFMRVRCSQCREELLVAHSCKDRGFPRKGTKFQCPSCTARRGAETAAHLVDDVLPHVPLRQFVLALPFDLHLRAARDAQVQRALLTIFVEELRELLRGLTNTGEDAQCGSVTFVQLFGSSLNLHVRFHLLALDGVYVPDGEGKPPRFVRAPAPTREQLGGLVRSVALRARQLLSRRPAPEPVEELQQPALKLFGAELRPAGELPLPLADVVSPATGVVLRIVREDAGVVAAGTALAEIGDTAQLEVAADLLSTEAARVVVGAPASVHDWGGPPLAAHVTRVERSGFTKVSALGVDEQRVPVVLAFDAPPPRALGDKFRVEVSIVVADVPDAVAVPTGAVFRGASGWAAYLLEDGRARRRELELGEHRPLEMQVISGVAAGETVIVYPPEQVADGVRVRAR